jgi:hypothetical protein
MSDESKRVRKLLALEDKDGMDRPMKHDANDCKCAADEDRLKECRTWGAAATESAMEPECRCRCDECGTRKTRLMRMIDLARIESRLTRANIAPAQLATLLWAHVTDGLEEWIARVTKEALVTHLSEMKMTTRVYLDASNVQFGNEAK